MVRRRRAEAWRTGVRSRTEGRRGHTAVHACGGAIAASRTWCRRLVCGEAKDAVSEPGQ